MYAKHLNKNNNNNNQMQNTARRNDIMKCITFF